MNRDEFLTDYPHLFFLDLENLTALRRYLAEIGVLADGRPIVAVSKAGQGNMNCTLRVQLAGGASVVVKQSRPWVERYPEIDAPWDRALSEARFYILTSAHDEVAAKLPKLIEVDPENRVLVLEDLGAASDFTDCYRGSDLEAPQVRSLVLWLAELHAIPFQSKTRASLTNLDMRRLNHEHLFRFPLDVDNGLDLDAITAGLQVAASDLAGDAEYRARVGALGELYLGAGNSLLHGDFFPGSWLQTRGGPFVIDPEFAFFGPAEFDVGVMLAHLYLGRQNAAVHETVVSHYQPGIGFNWRLALEFCGVEIMRRLIGVAQLPITYGLTDKQRLLQLSRDLILADDLQSISGLQAAELLEQRLDSQDETGVDVKRA